MCENPEVILIFFVKTVKIHYILKGLNENPAARMRKKGGVALFTSGPPPTGVYINKEEE